MLVTSIPDLHNTFILNLQVAACVCVRESVAMAGPVCSAVNKKRGYIGLCQDHCRCYETKLVANKLKNKFLILTGVENLAVFGTFSFFFKVPVIIYICVP